ncbi:ankyrin repeat domain-containing protein [Holosporaceae bacterium 'Namur']|nr:ankyrin repeat domain-containing protein [Holosporaceae bacterium 'Namur']
MENKGKRIIAAFIGACLIYTANLAIAEADPTATAESDDIESKVSSELEELNDSTRPAPFIPPIPRINVDNTTASPSGAVSAQPDKISNPLLKSTVSNSEANPVSLTSSPVPLSIVKNDENISDNPAVQPKKAPSKAYEANKGEGSNLPNNFDEKFNYFYSQTQRTLKETKEEAEKAPFIDEQDPLNQMENLYLSSPNINQNKSGSASDKPSKADASLKKKNNYSPYIYNRKVYDYRNTILSPQISKKHYGSNNQHLPKTFYQKEYSEYLFIAAINDDVSSIRAFLEKGADINAQDVKYGYTPLMYSILYNKQKSYNYLITKGADLNIRSNDGKTVAHLAAIANNIKAFELLIDYGVDPNIHDNQGNSPYYYSTQFTDEFAYIAVKQYKNMNKALIDFTKNGSIAAVKQTLRLGADTNYKDADGNTALIIAVQKNNVKLAGYLLSKDSNPLLRNKIGLSAIDYAAMNNSKELKDILKTVIITKELEGTEEVNLTKNEERFLSGNFGRDINNAYKHYSRCNSSNNLKAEHQKHEGKHKGSIEKEAAIVSHGLNKVKKRPLIGDKPLKKPKVIVSPPLAEIEPINPVTVLPGTKNNQTIPVVKSQVGSKQNDNITLKAPKVVREPVALKDSKIASDTTKANNTVITAKPERATKVIIKPQAVPKTLITTNTSSQVANSKPLASKSDKELKEEKKVKTPESKQDSKNLAINIKDMVSKPLAKQDELSTANEKNAASKTPVVPAIPVAPKALSKPTVLTIPVAPIIPTAPEVLSKPAAADTPVTPVAPPKSSVASTPVVPVAPIAPSTSAPSVVKTTPADTAKKPTSLLPY